ncbi:MBL fold metallo-hydrolase [Methanothermobacter sp. THM-2]|uniref:MBL fold metallo-hydrolase n=1 Tax=Methanothermobacter sp. THM-2 TaxID=2606912 RepID=UPI0013654F61|nr:MBL fold metallo-hydrolase [Methanothermobacter sp. THM-2]QHN07900.1 MBL fold metallo-hydrolase [Methanothermobacter sp. THM-2]
MLLKIICLVEDTPKDPLMGEHGLSLYIESDIRILFDMGQSRLFAENARRLGVDLREVDVAVISHGHYDHGGGLRHFLEINDSADVLMGEGAFTPRYAINGDWRFIGLEEIHNDRIKFISKTESFPGFVVIRDFGDLFERPPGNRTLFACLNGKPVPDRFSDELAIVIEDEGHLNLITGCSHNGILNIVSKVSDIFHKPLDLLVGGFHLEGPSEEVASWLGEFVRGPVYTGHCTSEEARLSFAEGPVNVSPFQTGTEIIT